MTEEEQQQKQDRIKNRKEEEEQKQKEEDLIKEAEDYEKDHVHNVYESIANHFSQTRFKPWPLVSEFLNRQPFGSLGLDVGSGNGKYLHGHNLTNSSNLLNKNDLPIGAQSPKELIESESKYLLLGLDRSISLLKHSNHHSNPELLRSDCLSLPFRFNLHFDFVISIATLHHLSTIERRSKAVKDLLMIILPSSKKSNIGKLLIFVWAHEQGSKSRRIWEKGTLLPAPQLSSSLSTSQLHSSDSLNNSIKPQDVLVPWVLNQSNQDSSDHQSVQPMVYNRYYHLFREGELIELVKLAAQSIPLTFLSESDQTVPQSQEQGWCRILRHGWEADNWWVEVGVGKSA